MQETDINLITDAIKGAGRIASRYSGATAQSWEKPGGAGPVTEADIAVNDYLQNALLSARPDYGWLSEESEDNADRLNRDTVFVVDPIDGTRSFKEGSRTWAHSVALVYKGRVLAGAIYLPLRELLYTATAGKGAFLNGTPLNVSARETLDGADILATRPVMAETNWPRGVPGFQRSHRPSLAYRLGLVGEGRFDAMLTLRPTWEWDVAAGAIIVNEARGICTDRNGSELRFNNKTPKLNGMIASGATLHGLLMGALQR